MIDAHFHRRVYSTFLAGDGREVRFLGFHPWQTAAETCDLAALEAALRADSAAGVGEIGLDRLKTKEIAPPARAAFAAQLELAARFARPVVLHGAKCWGEVVKACQAQRGKIPAFLFHGFSRSGGLVGDIVRLNGFISVGPALLNDHAVNYRRLVAELPPDRVLVETDLADDDPVADRVATLDAVYAKLAELRGLSVPELAAEVAANTARLLAELPR